MKISLGFAVPGLTTTVAAMTLWLNALSPGHAQIADARLSEQAQTRATQQIDALLQDKATRTPAQKKMDSHLIYAAREATVGKAVDALPAFRARLKLGSDGRVEVDILGQITEALLTAIRNRDGKIIDSHPELGAARVALAPIDIEPIAARDDVRSIRRAVKAHVHTGRVDSEGDTTEQAISARQTFAATGVGVSVGVLSDSADDGKGTLAAAYASGDLDQNNTVIVSGQGGTGDGEGGAMMQIIHDLAPGAKIYFAQGGPTESQMAANIRTLAKDGCKVIVDDITFDDESPFQDGAIAQAVDDVTAQGVLYFSSAANAGNLEQKTAGVWEGDFKDGGDASAADNAGARYHAFTTASGATTKNNKIDDGDGDAVGNLFWSDPLGKSANDYDLFEVDSTGTVVDASTDTQDGTQDPYETIDEPKVGNFLEIVKSSGAARFLHLESGEVPLAIGTTGNVRGHNAPSATANMFCVAAAACHAPFTDGDPAGPYPNAFNANSVTETFTSDGPRRMFYTRAGALYTSGNVSSTGGQVFGHPDLTAGDGVVTSCPADSGLNPFYGTSCAAPHAAAIAALLLSYKPSLTAAQADAALRTGVVKIAETAATAGAGILLAPNVLQNAEGAGTLALSASTYGVNESAGTVTAKVSRSGGSGGAVTVTCATSGNTAKAGTDYTGVSKTLSWASGDASLKSFTVAIKDIGLTNGSTKQFSVQLSAVTGGAKLGTPATGTVTIDENDPEQGELRFLSSSDSVAEDAGSLTVHVERLAGSTGAVSVVCGTESGTAKAGTDYTGKSATLSWAAGDTTEKTFTVPITNRGASGGNGLQFDLVLSSPKGSAILVTPTAATVTIH